MKLFNLLKAVHGESEVECGEREWRQFLVNSPLQSVQFNFN